MSGTPVEHVLSEYRFKGDLKSLDFVPVVSVDFGGGYDWDEFHAWYSPSRRVFFWTSGAGCSCNSISDDIYSIDDLENGRERADVMAAVRSYFDGRYDDKPGDRVEALAEVNAFRVPRADA